MSNRIKGLHIVHCKLVITQQRSYCRSFCFCVLKSHLTPLFISSYDFAANVIYKSTQGLCVVITILFSSLTFATFSKKAIFFICDSGGTYKRNCSPRFFFQNKSFSPASSTKSSPHKNIPLTVAQHFPERYRTLSRMYKNILLTAAQDFMAQYRLFCKHTTHKNTIELFSNIETCFTIFLPFVVHSLIIIFYKGLNFVYFPVI